ncbi:hypothetical protein [Chitinasiproducens palmae]|uniref:Rap1a immunity protein domain-containing protein n=1 Tax=Chitinasiproducens palmae TaxID=1770053 RepID=A0A1H2PR90_9BURK|nr:hypothetical protein [Chitinasiproducens palmae]SDV49394.1 hypothetical protein SAMN05216551_10841 [Chitinasiproducens palmae]
MKQKIRYAAAVLTCLAPLALACQSAQAQAPAAPTAPNAQAAAPTDAPTGAPTGARNAMQEAAASWNAYTLMQQCQDKSDNVSQAQCTSAVRGVVHGYQYGVLFLAQHATVDNKRVQPIALCIDRTPLSTLVDEYVQDAQQVSPETLSKTPAEVALLGSIHQHHPCR